MSWLRDYDTKLLPIIKKTECYRKLALSPAEREALDAKDKDMTKFWQKFDDVFALYDLNDDLKIDKEEFIKSGLAELFIVRD